jgi:hypothetical protein
MKAALANTPTLFQFDAAFLLHSRKSFFHSGNYVQEKGAFINEKTEEAKLLYSRSDARRGNFSVHGSGHSGIRRY